jgi:hypothetical protein
VLVSLAASIAIAQSPRVAMAAEPSANDACFSSYENAQRLRQAGRLRAAKSELAICEAESCPEFIRSGCTKWDTEVTDATPSIVVTAKDENGHDTTAVHVVLDDVAVADQIDGRPISVDPGQHHIRYERGTSHVEDTFVIGQGEKNRQLTADFRGVAGPAQPTGGGIPTATWILGGVAVVAATSFTVFAISGKAKEGCAPTCSQSNVDVLRRDYLVADISLGVGLVATGLAVWFALAHPSSPTAPPATHASAIAVHPSIDPHGAGLSVGARF